MKSPRILIAGIGNIFLGDDAFGVEVVRHLAAEPLPAGVVAIDFGIRGFDLASAIVEGYDAVILVDAASRGGPPGTVYVIEQELESPRASAIEAVEGHSLNPERVLQWVQAWGERVPPWRLVGCEPASFGSDCDPQMGLSAPVAAAVEGAMQLIHSLVAEFFREGEFSSKTAQAAGPA